MIDYAPAEKAGAWFKQKQRTQCGTARIVYALFFSTNHEKERK